MSSTNLICYLRTQFRVQQRAHDACQNSGEPHLKYDDNAHAAPADARLDALLNWLHGIPDTEGAELSPASSDASFRRYFRVSTPGGSWIAMDAPPPKEDCRPFIAVAGYLRSMSINAPAILAQDLERGFLLMTDLGNLTYLSALTRDARSQDPLYDDAVDALVRMQRLGARHQAALPPYDKTLLEDELALFRDWLCERHLGIRFTPAEEREWRQICAALVDNALSQPKVFVHRDYHSRNLMVTDPDNPGVLDFQDAVEGPYTYDLASLLKDCYRRMDDAAIKRLALRFHAGVTAAGIPEEREDDFWRSFELMGVQRHLKAAGIFARLLHRDAKSGYMADVPRTLRYVLDVAADHTVLLPLAELIAERCLPALEQDRCAP